MMPSSRATTSPPTKTARGLLADPLDEIDGTASEQATAGTRRGVGEIAQSEQTAATEDAEASLVDQRCQGRIGVAQSWERLESAIPGEGDARGHDR